MQCVNSSSRSLLSHSRRPARALLALMACGLLMLSASSAFALDGYADRKGVFVGLGLGGGVGAVDMDKQGSHAGFDDGRQLGASLHGIIGGGVNENILLGLGVNTWLRSVEVGSQKSFNQHWNFLATGNFFLIEGLYVEGGAGFAYGVYNYEAGNTYSENNEMGLALRGGVGYEFFLNGTQAMGVTAGYTRHFYANASFDTLSLGGTFRWY